MAGLACGALISLAPAYGQDLTNYTNTYRQEGHAHSKSGINNNSNQSSDKQKKAVIPKTNEKGGYSFVAVIFTYNRFADNISSKVTNVTFSPTYKNLETCNKFREITLNFDPRADAERKYLNLSPCEFTPSM